MRVAEAPRAGGVCCVEARAHPGGGVRHGEAAAAAAREEAAERGSHLRSRALSLLPMEDRTAHTVVGAQVS